MTKKQQDLLQAAQNLNLTTWYEVEEFSDKFKKYKSLSFKQFDEVVSVLETQ